MCECRGGVSVWLRGCACSLDAGAGLHGDLWRASSPCCDKHDQLNELSRKALANQYVRMMFFNRGTPYRNGTARAVHNSCRDATENGLPLSQ
jgi:hypothetical protein